MGEFNPFWDTAFRDVPSIDRTRLLIADRVATLQRQPRFKQYSGLVIFGVGFVILVIMAIIIGIVVAVARSDGGKDKEDHKVKNVRLGDNSLFKDNDVRNRMAYGFQWDPPDAKDKWYYKYSIYDAKGTPLLTDQCTNDTHALIKPYIAVDPGSLYTIDIETSKHSDCSSTEKGSKVTFSGLYPKITLKPKFGYNIEKGKDELCDMWLHIVPSNYFSMLGNYVVTVVHASSKVPVIIGEITYSDVNVFPDTPNLQYSLPFNYGMAEKLLVTTSGSNIAGSTIMNQVVCNYDPTKSNPICS